MKQEQLAKLWFGTGLVLLYYTLNSWIVSQGGEEIFGAHLIVLSRVPAAMIAIPVCTTLLLVSSLVGRLYARRCEESRWHQRIPVVGFRRIETGSPEGRLYQAAALFLFSVLPVIALAHFWRMFGTASVMRNDGTKAPLAGVWDWRGLTSLNDPARICTNFDAASPDRCTGSASLLPGIEPTAFALLTVAALVLALAHWRALASGERR